MIRINFKDLKFPDPFAKECILTGGSKFGPDMYLRKKWAGTPLEKHLPEGEYYLPPEDIKDPAKVEEFVRSIPDSGKPKIVRGCVLPNDTYPGDFAGAVDLIPTKRGICTRAGIVDSIETLTEYSSSQKVKDYIVWDGSDSDPLFSVLVEDYYKGIANFSVIEHPSADGIYIAEASGELAILQGVYDNEEYLMGSDNPEFFTEGIKIYKLIKDSGLIPEGYSFHMEYVFDDNDNLKVVQVKLFRKKEKRGDFDIPHGLHEYSPIYHSFGVTEKDGLKIDICDLEEAPMSRNKNKKEMAYALYTPFTKRSPDIGLIPSNMTAFIGNVNSKTFLEHGYFRYLQRAKIGQILYSGDLQLRLFRGGTRKVQIFSNGIHSGFVFLEPCLI